MTTYRLFPATNGPGTAVSNAGNFIAGVLFAVAGGGNWFDGYWWWVCGASQSTSPVKCALWSVTGTNAGSVVPGSVVTSGTLTAGQWNYIPLASPLQLAASYDANSSVNGSAYIAAVGVNGNFPYNASQFDTGDVYAAGITNGPLTAYSGTTGSKPPPWSMPQGVFSVAGSDPSVTMPFTKDTSGDGGSNFWVDVQVDSAAPGGYSGSYRLWPNKADANSSVLGDLNVNYTVATEVSLSQYCLLNNIWYFSPAAASTLATQADVWSIGSGLSVASIVSPSWLTAAGSPYTAGSGGGLGTWVKAAFPGLAGLPAGSYRVSVYNVNGTSDTNWSPKDAGTDYWGETFTGAGAAGITWGPLSAPGWAAASAGYLYNAGNSGSTPQYSAGTVPHAQPPFGQLLSGAVDFPQLFAPVGGGTNQTQNYWVDLEVTPSNTPSPPTVARGGRMTSRLAETYRSGR